MINIPSFQFKTIECKPQQALRKKKKVKWFVWKDTW